MGQLSEKCSEALGIPPNATLPESNVPKEFLALVWVSNPMKSPDPRLMTTEYHKHRAIMLHHEARRKISGESFLREMCRASENVKIPETSEGIKKAARRFNFSFQADVDAFGLAGTWCSRPREVAEAAIKMWRGTRCEPAILAFESECTLTKFNNV